MDQLKTVHRHRLEPIVPERHAFVVDACRGRDVLHVGCVDHGYLHDRLRTGRLLHRSIDEVARSVTGIDIDDDGIETLREAGFDDVLAANAETLDADPRMAGRTWDVIVATEILEHLSNPGLMLDGLRAIAARNGARLIVSVPNAYRIWSVLYALRGYEFVHGEHHYWFSPQTLVHLLSSHGFEVDTIHPYRAGDTPIRLNRDGDAVAELRIARMIWRRLHRLTLRSSRLFADGWIVIAHPSG